VSDYVNDSLDQKLTAMMQNRAAYKRNLAEVEADDNLSSTGKHEAAVELHQKATTRHEQLRAAYDVEVEETREALRKAAFAPQFGAFHDQAAKVATRAHYSAAMERASSMDAGELRAALERALRAEDEVAARAIAHVAWEKGAGRVLEAYMEHDKNGDLRRLYEFEGAYGDRRTVQKKFAHKVAFSMPEWPTF
jgi:hypothetical protein